MSTYCIQHVTRLFANSWLCVSEKMHSHMTRCDIKFSLISQPLKIVFLFCTRQPFFIVWTTQSVHTYQHFIYLCKCVHVMDVTQSEFQPDETDCFCLLVVIVVVNAKSNVYTWLWAVLCYTCRSKIECKFKNGHRSVQFYLPRYEDIWHLYHAHTQISIELVRHGEIQRQFFQCITWKLARL